MNDQDRAAQVWDVWEKAWVTWDEASNKADPECNTKAVEIIAAYGQERFRAGMEVTVDAGIKAIFPDGDYSANSSATLHQAICRFKQKIYELLAEQEKKG